MCFKLLKEKYYMINTKMFLTLLLTSSLNCSGWDETPKIQTSDNSKCIDHKSFLRYILLKMNSNSMSSKKTIDIEVIYNDHKAKEWHASCNRDSCENLYQLIKELLNCEILRQKPKDQYNHYFDLVSKYNKACLLYKDLNDFNYRRALYIKLLEIKSYITNYELAYCNEEALDYLSNITANYDAEELFSIISTISFSIKLQPTTKKQIILADLKMKASKGKM